MYVEIDEPENEKDPYGFVFSLELPDAVREDIGVGGFGNVYKMDVRRQHCGRNEVVPYAVKRVYLDRLKKDLILANSLLSAFNEYIFMSSLRMPRLVKAVAFRTSPVLHDHVYDLLRTILSFKAPDEEDPRFSSLRQAFILAFNELVELVGRLVHPKLPLIAYIVMEYIEGVPGQVWIARCRGLGKEGGHSSARGRTARRTAASRKEYAVPAPKMKFKDFVAIVARMLLVVQGLHRLNIAHGDLKPSNFLFLRDHTVRLIDYGTMRHMEHVALDFGITESYCAPERKGEGQATLGADLFSFGKTLERFARQCCDFRQCSEIERLEMRRLFTQMQMPLAVDRPTIAKALESSLFESVDLAKINRLDLKEFGRSCEIYGINPTVEGSERLFSALGHAIPLTLPFECVSPPAISRAEENSHATVLGSNLGCLSCCWPTVS